MIFDYRKLRGKIIEKCGTQYKFAQLMGLSKATITAKMQSKSSFTQDEISKAMEILSLSKDEVRKYKPMLRRTSHDRISAHKL